MLIVLTKIMFVGTGSTGNPYRLIFWSDARHQNENRWRWFDEIGKGFGGKTITNVLAGKLWLRFWQENY
jgi:hypothetical protein